MSLINEQNGATASRADERLKKVSAFTSLLRRPELGAIAGLVLAGTFDGRIVNISDEAPTTVYELVGLVGEKMGRSAEAMRNPWYLHVDASLARSLGFRPIVRTVYQAAQEGIL